MREFGEFPLPPIFHITYTITKKYYPGEPVNIHMQSLINIIQEENWFITNKKGIGKFPLFCSNGERVVGNNGKILETFLIKNMKWNIWVTNTIQRQRNEKILENMSQIRRK